MVSLSAPTTVSLACSCGEKPIYTVSSPTTIIETATAKEKADPRLVLNWVIEIPIAGSSPVVRNRMLRGAMNPAPEAYKLFYPGGQGHAYDVSLVCESTILHFTTSKEDICTTKMRSCVSCTLDEQRRVLDPGGLASITKIASSRVLCMGESRVRL